MTARAALPATLVALLVCAVGAPSARAMTVEPAPLPVLAGEADLVVHGMVVATATERVEGDRPRIRTRLTVSIFEILGGRDWLSGLVGAVEIVLPGGTWGRLTTRVPGVPELAVGDEVVLLLSRRGGAHMPIGYGLGTFRVDRAGRVERGWAVPDEPPVATLPALYDVLLGGLR